MTTDTIWFRCIRYSRELWAVGITCRTIFVCSLPTDMLKFIDSYLMLSIEELNEIDEMFDEKSDEEFVNDDETYDDWEKWDEPIAKPQKHVTFGTVIQNHSAHTYIEVVFNQPRWFAGCYKPSDYIEPLVFDMSVDIHDVYNIIDEKHSLQEEIMTAKRRREFRKARSLQARLNELQRLYE